MKGCELGEDIENLTVCLRLKHLTKMKTFKLREINCFIYTYKLKTFFLKPLKSLIFRISIGNSLYSDTPM